MDSKRIFYTIGILICLSLSSISGQDLNVQDKEDEYIPFSNDRYDTFDWNLLKAFDLSSDSENILISPFSVKVVFAMLYEASTGATEKELQNVLNLPISRHATRDRFQQIINSLREPSTEHILDIGSGIFLNSDLQPRERFSEIIQTHYNAFVNSINFDRPTEAAKQINLWASNVTHNHVKEIVTADKLNDSVMVLVNALYYKGLWKHPFNRNFTFANVFRTSSNKEVTAQYMLNYDSYFYSNYKPLDVQFLRIPFRGNISMFIILPNKVNGLSKFIKSFTLKDLQDMRWSLNKQEIDIRIPKFSFEYTSQMKEKLQNLGMTQIFQNIASLPGLTLKKTNQHLREIRVDSVIQKAGIEINEEGGTAWTATSATLVNKFGGQVIFDASRPFLFYLEDEYTGNVLFMGKIENPAQIEKLDIFEQILQGKRNIESEFSSKRQ